jgi:hypothetical protein
MQAHRFNISMSAACHQQLCSHLCFDCALAFPLILPCFSAAAMATLLHTTDFNARLKEAVDDAVVLVTG